MDNGDLNQDSPLRMLCLRPVAIAQGVSALDRTDTGFAWRSSRTLGGARHLVAGLATMVCAASPAGAIAGEHPACTVTSIQAIASSKVKIESVEARGGTDKVPAHCSVVGVVDEGSPVRFNLGLPQAWNGKFLFLGQGAFAGGLAALDQGIARGYATASTDTGHQAHRLTARWALNNPAATTNHFLRGTRRAVEMSKGIVNAYFSRLPRHSYFSGCSGGGRQGLLEASRFTGDFDGIVAAAPAWNYTKLFMTFTENSKVVLESPANWISPQKFEALDRAVLQQCDASDGVVDGMLGDPRKCNFDATKMMCRPGEDGPNCLTKPQIDTLERIRQPAFAKPGTGYFGLRLTGSEKYDAGRGWPGAIFGMAPPAQDKNGRLAFHAEVATDNIDNNSLPYAHFLQREFLRNVVFNDPAYDWWSFSIHTDGPKLEKQFGKLVNVDKTDLTDYVAMGGKLLIWHGWADDAIPAEMSIDLYERIRRDTKTVPGGAEIDQSVRLFMVPGVNHCSAGSGLTDFDALGALEKWVETGEAPARITAAQTAENGRRSRPLCPYPQVAHFSGTGDDKLASNFVCAAPK